MILAVELYTNQIHISIVVLTQELFYSVTLINFFHRILSYNVMETIATCFLKRFLFLVSLDLIKVQTRRLENHEILIE